MEKQNYIKRALSALIAFGLISGFTNAAFANLGEPSETTSSETVTTSTATSATETTVSESDEDHYYETYEVADANGRRYAKRRKKPSDWPNSRACTNIHAAVKAALGGNNARANCYMGLFFMETTCDATLTQRAGNAGNAHAAYGLCSLEKSLKVRNDNSRGPDCQNIQGVANQTKCCRAIMRKSPNYFGPYNRREVAQCG